MNNAQLTRLKALHTGLGRYVSGTIKPSRNNSFGTIPQKYSPEYPLNNYTKKNKAFNFFHRQLQHELKRRANAGLGVPSSLKNLLNQNATVRRFKQFPKNAEGAHAAAKQKFKNQINLRILENKLLERVISLNKVRTPREKEAIETIKKYYYNPNTGRGYLKLLGERAKRKPNNNAKTPNRNTGYVERMNKFANLEAERKKRHRASVRK
jgi:hypothetical protein